MTEKNKQIGERLAAGFELLGACHKLLDERDSLREKLETMRYELDAVSGIKAERNALQSQLAAYKSSLDAAKSEVQRLLAEKYAAPSVQEPVGLWQERCLAAGFRYARASDDHWVECTQEQAVDLLRDVLGVDVQIDPAPDHTASENESTSYRAGYSKAEGYYVPLLRQALEALRGVLEHLPIPSSICKERPAYEAARASITAIKEALK